MDWGHIISGRGVFSKSSGLETPATKPAIVPTAPTRIGSGDFAPWCRESTLRGPRFPLVGRSTPRAKIYQKISGFWISIS
jgi:hypothetical protein